MQQNLLSWKTAHRAFKCEKFLRLFDSRVLREAQGEAGAVLVSRVGSIPGGTKQFPQQCPSNCHLMDGQG